MIAPSDEDSFTFTVSAANGDIFKLRGMYHHYHHWRPQPGITSGYSILAVVHACGELG